MRTRRLADGLEVSAIGLGCMGLSEWYGTPDRDEAEATVELALASGVTLFDTADSYAMGRNEEAVGRMLRGRRDGLAISTKFGIVRDEQGALAGIDGRPEYVRGCCEASLRRLGVEVIDVYICHRVDPAVPVEETVGAMAELQAAGKVRHLGVSEATPDEIRRAHATAPLAVLQSEYSLASRDVEAEVLPLCESLGIALMAFSPLGRGLLTAAPPNADPRWPGSWSGAARSSLSRAARRGATWRTTSAPSTSRSTRPRWRRSTRCSPPARCPGRAAPASHPRSTAPASR